MGDHLDLISEFFVHSKKFYYGGIIVLLASTVIIYSLFSREIYAFYPILLCLFLIITKHVTHTNIYPNFLKNNSLKLLSVTLLFLAYSAIVLLTYVSDTPGRPFIAILLITLLVPLCFYYSIQDSRTYLPTILIVILGACIIFIQKLSLPGLIGVDPWTHAGISSHIYSNGHVLEGLNYTATPLFHILNVTVMNITGTSIFITSAIISFSLQISSLLCIYIISYLLFHNKQLSNLSALFVVIADQINYMTILSVPNTLAAVFTLFAVYFLVVQFQKAFSFRNIALVTLFSIVVLLTHQLTSMYLLIIILSFLLIQVLGPKIGLDKRVSLSKNGLLAISLICTIIAFFTCFSTTLQRLTTMASIGFDRSYLSLPDPYTASINVPLAEDLFGYSAIFLLFSLMIPGIVYMLKTRKQDIYFTLIVAIFPLAISIIGILGDLGVIEHRWWYFSQLYVSIPCAISLVLITNTVETRYKNTILILITAFIAFICIFSAGSCIDDHTFAPSSPRIYYTQPEIQGAYAQKYIGTGTAYTDMYFGANMNNYLREDIFSCIDPYFKSKSLNDINDGNILLRGVVVRGEPISTTFGRYFLNFDILLDFEKHNVAQFYDNGYSALYR